MGLALISCEDTPRLRLDIDWTNCSTLRTYSISNCSLNISQLRSSLLDIIT